MLEIIARLLELQDCDQQILTAKEQLARIPIDRQIVTDQQTSIQNQVDSVRKQIKELESKRKQLEIEISQKKEGIDKYSVQQFQTKKNDEYRAIEHQIQTTKTEIIRIEDRELEIMELLEKLEKELKELNKEEESIKKEVGAQLAELNECENKLLKELNSLQTKREQLSSAIEPVMLARYERILKNKNGKVLVGIDRGVCGGCHMRLSRQLVVDCRAQTEPCFCPNCGRIIYYTPEMDVATVD